MIVTATFHDNPKLTVTSVYAPTDGAALDDKNEFYNCLTDHLGTFLFFYLYHSALRPGTAQYCKSNKLKGGQKQQKKQK